MRTSQRALKNIMKVTLRSCQYVRRPRFLACTIILLQCMGAIRILIPEFLSYTCEPSYFNISVIPSLKFRFYLIVTRRELYFGGKYLVFAILKYGCQRYRIIYILS
jgi:hypothetical protein